MVIEAVQTETRPVQSSLKEIVQTYAHCQDRFSKKIRRSAQEIAEETQASTLREKVQQAKEKFATAFGTPIADEPVVVGKRIWNKKDLIHYRSLCAKLNIAPLCPFENAAMTAFSTHQFASAILRWEEALPKEMLGLQPQAISDMLIQSGLDAATQWQFYQSMAGNVVSEEKVIRLQKKDKQFRAEMEALIALYQKHNDITEEFDRIYGSKTKKSLILQGLKDQFEHLKFEHQLAVQTHSAVLEKQREDLREEKLIRIQKDFEHQKQLEEQARLIVSIQQDVQIERDRNDQMETCLAEIERSNHNLQLRIQALEGQDDDEFCVIS